MPRQRTRLGRAGRVAVLALVACALLVGLVLAWPVASPGAHHSAGAATEQQVPVPEGALGGLGVSGVLGTSLLFGLRGRRRGPGDP